MRDELVASAIAVSRWLLAADEDNGDGGGVRKMESMISSLYPMTCRLMVADLSEWKRMFWSEWMDTRVEVEGL